MFGFDLINEQPDTEDGHWVVYDEENEEFYGSDENLQFNFSTLEGFFKYAEHRAKNKGFRDCQFAMRKVLRV